MSLLWITATFFAFFVKGLCGFANTLIFTSILGFGVSNLNISPVELVLGYPANLIMSFKERKNIKWSFCIPIIILLVIGMIPGIFLLKTANPTPVKIVCGIIVALAGAEMILRENSSVSFASSKSALIIVGISAGVLCGLFGIGVILGAYLSRVTDNINEFKGTLSLIFAIENTVRIISYSVLGIVTLASLQKSLMLIPVMLLGLFLGMKASTFLPEKKAKRLVSVMLIISGVALVITNI